MNRLRTVVHLIENEERLGGMEHVALRLAAATDRGRYKTRIWYLMESGPSARMARREGIPTRAFAMPRYMRPRNLARLAAALREARVDILHTHGFCAGRAGRLASLLFRRPVAVHHIHTTAQDTPLWKTVLAENLLNLRTPSVICVSRSVRDSYLRREPTLRNRARIIYNGVDPAQFRVNADPDGHVVATTASLLPHKGHRVLLNAAAQLRAHHPEARYVWMGTGPLDKELRQGIHRKGLGDVIALSGHTDRVADGLAGASVFVLPSLREGLGIAILEAMASGLPVVASRVGGIPEVVVDGRTGLLVPPGDPARLAEAIDRLLRDPDMRHAMGREGRKRVERRFTFANMVGQVEAVYRRALGA